MSASSTTSAQQGYAHPPTRRPMTRARILSLLFVGLLLLVVPATAQARSSAGAGTGPEGATEFRYDIGSDMANLTGGGFTVLYSPLENLQIGVNASTFGFGASAGGSVKVNAVRTDENRFMLSFQAAANYAGFFGSKSVSTLIPLDSENALSLDSRMIAEWRPSRADGWGTFAEFGGVHIRTKNAANYFFNGDSNTDSIWRHALRAGIGFHVPLGEEWDFSSRGGIIGGSGRPTGYIAVGLSAHFD